MPNDMDQERSILRRTLSTPKTVVNSEEQQHSTRRSQRSRKLTMTVQLQFGMKTIIHGHFDSKEAPVAHNAVRGQVRRPAMTKVTDLDTREQRIFSLRLVHGHAEGCTLVKVPWATTLQRQVHDAYVTSEEVGVSVPQLFRTTEQASVPRQQPSLPQQFDPNLEAATRRSTPRFWANPQLRWTLHFADGMEILSLVGPWLRRPEVA